MQSMGYMRTRKIQTSVYKPEIALKHARISRGKTLDFFFSNSIYFNFAIKFALGSKVLTVFLCLVS